ncbi:MAG: hypothetical protein AAF664_20095 [Planctomycetota bacterium]
MRLRFGKSIGQVAVTLIVWMTICASLAVSDEGADFPSSSAAKSSLESSERANAADDLSNSFEAWPTRGLPKVTLPSMSLPSMPFPSMEFPNLQGSGILGPLQSPDWTNFDELGQRFDPRTWASLVDKPSIDSGEPIPGKHIQSWQPGISRSLQRFVNGTSGVLSMQHDSKLEWKRDDRGRWWGWLAGGQTYTMSLPKMKSQKLHRVTLRGSAAKGGHVRVRLTNEAGDLGTDRWVATTDQDVDISLWTVPPLETHLQIRNLDHRPVRLVAVDIETTPIQATVSASEKSPLSFRADSFGSELVESGMLESEETRASSSQRGEWILRIRNELPNDIEQHPRLWILQAIQWKCRILEVDRSLQSSLDANSIAELNRLVVQTGINLRWRTKEELEQAEEIQLSVDQAASDWNVFHRLEELMVDRLGITAGQPSHDVHLLSRGNHVWSRLPVRKLGSLAAHSTTRADLIEKSNPDDKTFVSWISKEGDRPIANIINLAPWEQRFDVHWSTRSFPLLNENHEVGDAAQIGAEDIRVPPLSVQRIELPPEETIESSETTSDFASGIRGGRWQITSALSSETQKEIKSKLSGLTSVAGRLGAPIDSERMKDRTIPESGGFEKTGPLGLVGWMQSQYPAGAIERSTDVAFAGEASVRIERLPDQNSRPWLVSEPFEITGGEPISLSMAYRSEGFNSPGSLTRQAETALSAVSNHVRKQSQPDNRNQAQKAAVLRVTVEADQGFALDTSSLVRLQKEVSLAAGTRWTPPSFVLVADSMPGLENGQKAMVHVTLDLLSPATIWLDEVQVHRFFTPPSQRSQLESEAFLAVQGVQRGRWEAAAKLLRHPLAERLLNLPETPRPSKPFDATRQPVAAQLDEPESSLRDTDDPQNNSGTKSATVAEKIRSWMPAPLRF